MAGLGDDGLGGAGVGPAPINHPVTWSEHPGDGGAAAAGGGEEGAEAGAGAGTTTLTTTSTSTWSPGRSRRAAGRLRIKGGAAPGIARSCTTSTRVPARDVDGNPSYHADKSVYETPGIPSSVLSLLAETEYHASEILAAVAGSSVVPGSSEAGPFLARRGAGGGAPDMNEVLSACWALTPWLATMPTSTSTAPWPSPSSASATTTPSV